MRIALCRPARDTVDFDNHECVEQLKAHWRSNLIDVPVRGYPNLDMARSIGAARAVRAGAEVMLWIDSDVVFDAAAAVRMLGDAVERRAVIGAVTTTKQPRGALTVQGLEGDVGFYEAGELVPVRAVSFGLCVVPTVAYLQIVERLRLPALTTDDERELRPAWMPFPIDGRYPSEDFAFCWRARAAGVQVLADTRVRTAHVGRYGYRVEDALAKVPDAPTLRVQVAANGTHP